MQSKSEGVDKTSKGKIVSEHQMKNFKKGEKEIL